MTDPTVPDQPPVPPAVPPVPPYSPPPAVPYGAGPARPSTVLSLLSMIAGILAVLLICCCGGGVLPGIAAVVMGHLGLQKENAKGMAKTGLILGYIGGGLSLILGVLMIFAPELLNTFFPWANFYSSFNLNN